MILGARNARSQLTANGRELSYDYGMSTSIDDLSGRIASLIDSDVPGTHLTHYSYLGLEAVVQQDSLQAELRYTLVSLTGTNDPDTGDIYSGLDRFGRIVDLRWRNTATNSDQSRMQFQPLASAGHSMKPATGVGSSSPMMEQHGRWSSPVRPTPSMN